MTIPVLSSLLVETRSGYWGVESGASDSDALVVRNGDIQEEGIQWDRLPTRGFSEDELNRAALRADDLLITTSGECGYVAHVERDPQSATIASNFVRLLRFDRNLVLPRYVYHFAKTAAFRASLAPFIRGTTLKNLAFSTAADRVHVPLPGLPVQARIAAILDKADSLRVKRLEAIAKIDCLAQSVFLDMFGESKANPKGWQVAELGTLILDGPQNGIYKPASEYGSGTPIVRIDSFKAGDVIQNPPEKRVRLSDAEVARYRLRPDDLLINRVNSPEHLGKPSLVGGLCEPTVFESNMMRISLDTKRVLPAFLLRSLLQQHVREQIRSRRKDAVNQSSINQTDVCTLAINLPPIELQERFSAAVSAIVRLRKLHSANASKASSMFESLSSSFFR